MWLASHGKAFIDRIGGADYTEPEIKTAEEHLLIRLLIFVEKQQGWVYACNLGKQL